MNTPALSLKNVSYSYRSEWTRHLRNALHDLCLDVHPGEAFGFLGHNGAGKTTTIKAILGIIRPQNGEISIFGERAPSPASRKKVGYLPEQPYFYDYLSVQEAMSLYATLSGLRGDQCREQIKRALDRVKLSGRTKSPLRALSKGLTQRLALAQAIVACPHLLILDEPFSGLDPVGRVEFREILLDLKKEGTTLFLCSHILSDVEYLCDRASILVQGRIRGVYELKSAPELAVGHFEIVLDSSPTALSLIPQPQSRQLRGQHDVITYSLRSDAEEALRVLLSSKISVDSFQYVHASLEDLFVDIVSAERSAHE
jgi:ABC-2 type transport system ATP-binding protein